MIMVYKITQGYQYSYHWNPQIRKALKVLVIQPKPLKVLRSYRYKLGLKGLFKTFMLSPVAPWSEVLVLVVDLLGGHLQGVEAARQPLNLDSGSKPLALRHQIWGSLLLPSN